MVGDSRFSRRDLAKRAAALGLVAPAVGLAARGAWQASAQATEPTGKLIVSMSVEPDTLENWNAYSTDGHPSCATSRRRCSTATLSPTSWSASWRPPGSRPTTAPGASRCAQGVTFHDGDPFNAEVAAFGINYTWSPENDFEIYQFIGPHITATAVDEYTLDVATESAGPDPARRGSTSRRSRT